ADHAHGLRGAGSRKDRIGTQSLKVVDRQGGYAPIAIESHSGRDDMFTRMRIRNEAFDPVSDEFDWPAKQARDGADRELVWIHVHLHAEAAPNIPTYDPHIRWREAK